MKKYRLSPALAFMYLFCFRYNPKRLARPTQRNPVEVVPKPFPIAEAHDMTWPSLPLRWCVVCAAERSSTTHATGGMKRMPIRARPTPPCTSAGPCGRAVRSMAWYSRIKSIAYRGTLYRGTSRVPMKSGIADLKASPPSHNRIHTHGRNAG